MRAGQLVLSHGTVPDSVTEAAAVHAAPVQAHQLVGPARWAVLHVAEAQHDNIICTVRKVLADFAVYDILR